MSEDQENFQEIRKISRETGKRPASLAAELHAVFPEGGIAIHGGSTLKVESICRIGFQTRLSQYRRSEGKGLLYYIASSAKTPGGEETVKERGQRTREFFKAAREAAGWGVARSLGSELSPYYFYAQLHNAFDQGGEMAIEPGNAKAVSAEYYPAIVIFQSGEVGRQDYRLNRLPLSSKSEPGKYANAHEIDIDLPPELVAGTVKTTLEELRGEWKRAGEDVSEFAEALQQVKSYKNWESFRDELEERHDLSDQEKKWLTETASTGLYLGRDWTPYRYILAAKFFSRVEKLLAGKLIEKVNELYGY
jgi:hypothetical protein